MNRLPLGTEGRPAIGSWITLGDPLAAEIMARAGFDFLILDAQHGAVHEGNLLPLLQAAALGGTPALVRVKRNDAAEIGRALDFGAAGVVVPMVSTPAEAAAAAQACRYPPHGIRSFGRVRGYHGGSDLPEAEPICLVMIETVQAMEELEAIAGTTGIDGLFAGPADLGLSMGFQPSAGLPQKVCEAMEQISTAACEAGLIPGVACAPAHVAEMRATGMTFIATGADSGFLRRAAGEEAANSRAGAALAN